MAYSKRPSDPRSFSSQSQNLTRGPSASRIGYPSVMVSNPALLRNSPNIQLNPADRELKSDEKKKIVGLNDKFVKYIEKVRSLDQKNRTLKAKLDFLLKQEGYRGNIDEIAAELTNNLKYQVEALAEDQKKLQSDLTLTNETVDQYRAQYEDEVHRKPEIENEFILLKKDVDDSYLRKVTIELQLEDVMVELDFLKKAYEEEIKELKSQIQNAVVYVKADNVKPLDMEEVVRDVKAQYQEVAERNKDETEKWHKKKMQDMTSKTEENDKLMLELKKEIADLQRLIQKLKLELDGLKLQKKNLESGITEATNKGQEACNTAMEQIRQLEEALAKAKKDMAHQVHEYQKLMNIKLALDIEIATYRKLLEEEENWLKDNKGYGQRGPFN